MHKARWFACWKPAASLKIPVSAVSAGCPGTPTSPPPARPGPPACSLCALLPRELAFSSEGAAGTVPFLFILFGADSFISWAPSPPPPWHVQWTRPLVWDESGALGSPPPPRSSSQLRPVCSEAWPCPGCEQDTGPGGTARPPSAAVPRAGRRLARSPRWLGLTCGRTWGCPQARRHLCGHRPPSVLPDRPMAAQPGCSHQEGLCGVPVSPPTSGQSPAWRGLVPGARTCYTASLRDGSGT